VVKRDDDYRNHLVEARHSAMEDYDRAVLTFASATLALSVTFLHEIAPTPKPGTTWAVLAAWLLLGGSLVSTFLSIGTGIVGLGGAIKDFDDGKTEKLERPGGNWARSTDVLNVAAGIGFVLGLVLLSWFAAQNM
jgi:hypothetical protein